MMLRSLWRGDQAIRFSPKLSLRQWRWLLSFLSQCNDKAVAENTRVKARLCGYSQEVLQEVVADTGIAYERTTGGIVYFYRSQKAFEQAAEKSEILTSLGVAQEVLSRDETIKRDPGLKSSASQIAGAIFAPTDESGDCRIFTQALVEKCKEKGADFRFGVSLDDLELEGGEIKAAITDQGRIEGDAFVLCLGVYSPHLAEKLGLAAADLSGQRLFDDGADARQPEKGPQLGGVDEENLLAYCPMGNRLRLTATAEISGYSNAHQPKDFRVMKKRAMALFGDVADFDNASYWAGLRPMTPTGMPVIDRSPIDNFWFNTGHGHMGWTMSNGSARILADLIGQKKAGSSDRGHALWKRLKPNWTPTHTGRMISS